MTVSSNSLSAVVALAAIIIILAACKLASALLAPILLALFITIVLIPAVNTCRRFGIPHWWALCIVGALGIGSLIVMGSYFTNVALEIGGDIPLLEQRMLPYQQYFSQLLQKFGYSKNLDLFSILDPVALVKVFQTTVGLAQSMVSTTLLVATLLFFALAETISFPNKLKQALSPNVLANVYKVNSDIQQYMLVKMQMNTLTGVFLYVGLWALGIKYALAWSLLAFLLNNIPTIGSIIAAIPALLYVFVMMDPSITLAVIFLYLAVNIVVGNIIEPRIMGQKMGVSAFVVLLSLLLWGYVFAEIGMLLSVPLTMICKLLLQQSPSTSWLGKLFE